MNTVKKIAFISILFVSLTGYNCAFAQTKTSSLNIDSTKRDNTRVVKEKHIKDTSGYPPVGDTAIKTKTPAKSKQKNQSMYVVPESGKKKNKANKSH